MYLRKDDSKLTYNLVITIKNKDFPLSLLLARILKALKKKINELEYEYDEETYTLKVYKLPFKDIRKVLNNLRDFEEDLDIDLVPYGEQESYKEELSFSDELKIVAHSILKFEFLKEPIFWGLVIAIIPNYIYIFLGNNIESFFLVQNISLATLWLMIISIFLNFKFNLGIFLTLILSLLAIYFSANLVATLNKIFLIPAHIQAGFIEEAYKLAIALFFLRIFTEKSRWKIKNYILRFSILIGFIVGISFGIIENISYVKEALNITSIQNVKILGYLFAIIVHIARLFLTTLLHAIWTSISTFLAAFGTFRPFTTNYILTGYILSATLHAFYNYSVSAKVLLFQVFTTIISAFIFYSILKYVQKINV